MNCGIILFIYNRPQCTKKVLESLKTNHIKELYVFQDGIEEKTDRSAWEENADIINAIEWCEVHFEQKVCKAESLDEQIIYGINKVFEKKEEVIVIEEDCVISDDCIEFMEKCFDTYRNNKKVIDISAYLEPIKVPKDYESPVLAVGIPAGWGWGTWKDRWEIFQEDYKIIKRIGNSVKYYDGFSDFGYTIKKILKEYWLLETWDLWWSINVLEKKGISIRPTVNKVYNIGFEYPGVHTSGDSPWVVPIESNKKGAEILPVDIEIESWAQMEFKKFYKNVSKCKSLEERQTYYRECFENWIDYKQCGRSIASVLRERNIKNVVIYGTGNIGKLLIRELRWEISISYILVTKKTEDEFMGYSVFDCNAKFPEEEEIPALIVIPGYDIEEIEKTIGGYFKNIYPLDSLFGGI